MTELCSNWKIPEIIVKLGHLAQKNNLRAWIIGGWVRDALLGKQGKDIDIVVEAPDGGKKLAELAAKELGLKPPARYRRTGAAMLRYGDVQIELTPTRVNSYRQDGKRDNTFGSFADDVNHRDFTVNTLALELPSGRIVDPKGQGLHDLRDGIINTPVDPNLTFEDDPLRIMRAARFACSMGFTLHERLYPAARKWSAELNGIKVSPERVGIEYVKLISSEDPVLGVDLLLSLGACNAVMPEIAVLAGLEQPADYHHKDVYLHTLSVLHGVANKSESPVLRTAALLHDVGKARTRSLKKTRGKMRWTFHNHDVAGARMARAFVRRMKLAAALEMDQKELEETLFILVRYHLAHLEAHNWASSAVRRFVHRVGPHIDSLFTLMECDIVGHKNPETVGFSALKAKVAKINAADMTEENTKPAVDGNYLMKRFDRPPGRWIGHIQKLLRQAVIDGEVPPKDRDAALAWIETKIDDSGNLI